MDRHVYTVSGLNREARELLESGLGKVWVEGELSNLSRPASGHWYFSIKDQEAQVRCAMFRGRNTKVTFAPKDGQKVLIGARVSLYEPRGDYQLQVEAMEDAGAGALQRAFEELKKKLAAEGLFAEELKRPLPRVPRRIGVITSPSGAAIRDILHILAARFPAAEVIVYPVPVQGTAAAPAIVAAIALANRRAECDVLILARGGGSLEDLWPFNDERVARAIRASDIPLVSGVGHEVDFTIADFAADLRAPTPSGAAQLVVPDADEWLRALDALQDRFDAAIRRAFATTQEALSRLGARLTRAHPGTRINQHAQRLDELEQRLQRGIDRLLERRQTRFAGLARALNAVSPLATLDRGYSIVVAADGALLTDVANVKVGDALRIRLAKGQLEANVSNVFMETPPA